MFIYLPLSLCIHVFIDYGICSYVNRYRYVYGLECMYIHTYMHTYMHTYAKAYMHAYITCVHT